MQQNCPQACHKKTTRPPQTRHDDDQRFYDLTAKDANGKVVSMENFEGYVTVIVNAARVCGEFYFGVGCIFDICNSLFV